MDDTRESKLFTASLRQCLLRNDAACTTRRIARHETIYARGDPGPTIFVIESGQVKLLLNAVSGRECLLAIHIAGDIFGEMCLAGIARRQSTAVAMEETAIKEMPRARFLALLSAADLTGGLIKYLATRLGDQQRIISELMTVDSEYRHGEALLRLASRLGRHDPPTERIVPRISHEEYSQLVGTTRARVTGFMRKFHDLGLIQVTAGRHLIVKEKMLRAFLDAVYAR